jgi:rhodanese-related sulfurtransferase
MFSFLRSTPPAPPLAAAEAQALADRGGATLVDVRDISELRSTGKARGAVHVPLMLVQMRADPKSPEFDRRIDPARPVLIYCASGARSGMAAQMLRRMGYADVRNLGGFHDWVAGGGAVERV